MASKRMSGLFRKREPRVARTGLPDGLKGGLIERYVNYWKGVFRDYADALSEVRSGASERPLRASLLTLSAAAAVYANRRNPSERHFRERCLRDAHEIMTVPRSIRNPAAEKRQTDIARLDMQGQLRHWNLIFFSVMWWADYDGDLGLYASQCGYLSPGYADFRRRVVDVGFLGRWWLAERHARDLDVNPDEWDADGRPADRAKQWDAGVKIEL